MIIAYLSTTIIKEHADDDNIRELVRQNIETWGNDVDLNNIDVSEVTDMSGLFEGTDFCGDIDRWNVSNVKNMTSMFKNCSHFNGDLTGWEIDKECRTDEMFDGCFIDEKNKPVPLRLPGEKGSTQIKLFFNGIYVIEKEVNDFLIMHKDKMRVKDIKYIYGQSFVTIMMIYEVI